MSNVMRLFMAGENCRAILKVGTAYDMREFASAHWHQIDPEAGGYHYLDGAPTDLYCFHRGKGHQLIVEPLTEDLLQQLQGNRTASNH